MPRSGRHLACSTPAGIAVAPFGVGTRVARRHLTGHRARRYHRSALCVEATRPWFAGLRHLGMLLIPPDFLNVSTHGAGTRVLYHLPDILNLESAARITRGSERRERSIGGVQNHLASFRMWVPLQIVPVDSHTAVSLLQYPLRAPPDGCFRIDHKRTIGHRGRPRRGRPRHEPEESANPGDTRNGPTYDESRLLAGKLHLISSFSSSSERPPGQRHRRQCH